MSARSRLAPLSEPLPVPMRLMSQKTPAPRNPFGAVMDPLISMNLDFVFTAFASSAYKIRRCASGQSKNRVGEKAQVLTTLKRRLPVAEVELLFRRTRLLCHA